MMLTYKYINPRKSQFDLTSIHSDIIIIQLTLFFRICFKYLCACRMSFVLQTIELASLINILLLHVMNLWMRWSTIRKQTNSLYVKHWGVMIYDASLHPAIRYLPVRSIGTIYYSIKFVNQLGQWQNNKYLCFGCCSGIQVCDSLRRVYYFMCFVWCRLHH